MPGPWGEGFGETRGVAVVLSISPTVTPNGWLVAPAPCVRHPSLGGGFTAAWVGGTDSPSGRAGHLDPSIAVGWSSSTAVKNSIRVRGLGCRGGVVGSGYSYRYFSESASACSMSAIVNSGIRSWASVTSAEAGWASAGSHSCGFQAALRSSDLGQCG